MTKHIDPEEIDEIGEEVWDDPPEGPRKVSINWLWEMNETVNRMYAREDIDVHVYETYEPVSLFLLEQLETGLGITIPDQVRSFYRVTDGIDLRWSYRSNDEWIPGGQIKMHGFGTVFGNWFDTIWGRADEADEHAVDFSWELRGVEHQDRWQSEWRTVMHVPEDHPIFQLYFHDPDSQTLLLDLDFLDYCEALIDTRGVYGWQFLATEADFDERPTVGKHATRALEVLSTVFPEVDLSRFRSLDD